MILLFYIFSTSYFRGFLFKFYHVLSLDSLSFSRKRLDGLIAEAGPESCHQRPLIIRIERFSVDTFRPRGQWLNR